MKSENALIKMKITGLAQRCFHCLKMVMPSEWGFDSWNYYYFVSCLVFCLTTPSGSFALTFDNALSLLEGHKKIRGLNHSFQAMQETAVIEGVWGDPMLSIRAQDLPFGSLALDQEMMSGVMIGLSQRVPLTRKFSRMREAQLKRANALRLKTQQQLRELQKLLWRLAIEKERLTRELIIVQESHEWVSQILNVSQRLYANGQISQQALFDVQIRQSELEAKTQALSYEKKELESRLTYLVGKDKSDLDLTSIDWSILDREFKGESDYAEKSLKMEREALDILVSAQRLNRVPDLTFSVSYMSRQLDIADDLVSVGVSFSLPTSQRSWAISRQALELRSRAEINLFDFKNQKKNRLNELQHNLNRVQAELRILQERTIQYAKNSREITGSSYKHGRATYFELLNSEIRLQEILSREVALEANVKNVKLEKLYVSGGQLK